MITSNSRGHSFSDRLLAGSIQCLIVSLISALAVLALVLAYQGLLSLFVGNLFALPACLLPAGLSGVGSILLFRFRNDLMR